MITVVYTPNIEKLDDFLCVVSFYCSLFFWVSGREIHMKTLNGLVETVCYTAPRDPEALTVDVSRQLLYWVSYSNEMVIVSQVEYSRSGCGTR